MAINLSLPRAFVAAALVAASVAYADEGPPPHGEPPAAGEHGAPAAGEHGAPAAGEHGAPAAGEHGAEGGAHHVDYTGDDDHDGVPNWMDSDAGDAFVAYKLGFHAINLILLIGLLAWFVRRPVHDALMGRAHDIRKQLTDSARERDEAAHKHAELEARLGSFEQELERMRASAMAEAKAEEERLVARAHDEARRIGETAERNIRDEVARARVALQHDAIELAVKLAENTLRSTVNPDDQKRLARDFLASLTEVGRG